MNATIEEVKNLTGLCEKTINSMKFLSESTWLLPEDAVELNDYVIVTRFYQKAILIKMCELVYIRRGIGTLLLTDGVIMAGKYNHKDKGSTVYTLFGCKDNKQALREEVDSLKWRFKGPITYIKIH